ncbi:MAG: hypothetical protein K2J95_09545 [Lachnospiraceae bacterium]|nr:hypothetical protein [Lachnospiraceae bacterium]
MKNKLDSLFFNQQFESEPQIALIADEKPPTRISHRVSSQQAALTWGIRLKNLSRHRRYGVFYEKLVIAKLMIF